MADLDLGPIREWLTDLAAGRGYTGSDVYDDLANLCAEVESLRTQLKAAQAECEFLHTKLETEQTSSNRLLQERNRLASIVDTSDRRADAGRRGER